jgi:hypothetical protein
MDSTPPPSPEPAAAAPTPQLHGVGSRGREAFGRYARTLFAALLNWPGGRWPVPTVTSLFVISLLVVAAVELLPKGWSDVTLSVRAQTEVLLLDLQPERTYVWWLPGGSYSLLRADHAKGCEQRSRFDVVCPYSAATAVTIKNGATVRFELTTAEGAALPRFLVALTPRAIADHATDGEPARSVFEVRSGADESLVETSDLLTFESQPVQHWRIPLIAERVQIGESLSDSVAAADALGTIARQPIMTAGDVRMFARAFGFGADERYQIKDERFDPADVVQIPADQDQQGLLLGLLSLDADAQREFDVTLHSDLAEVFVRRLGAEHRIGVSMWKIVSQLPMWLALWVVWVSLIVVANYYSDRLGELRGQKSEAQQT